MSLCGVHVLASHEGGVLSERASLLVLILWLRLLTEGACLVWRLSHGCLAGELHGKVVFRVAEVIGVVTLTIAEVAGMGLVVPAHRRQLVREVSTQAHSQVFEVLHGVVLKAR